MNASQRKELSLRYVNLINRIGKVAIGGSTLRDRMSISGIDFWEASKLRESSSWGSPIFDRIDTLRQNRSQKLISTSQPSVTWVQIRSLMYWLVNAVLSLKNRPSRVRADVLFVVFFPETATPEDSNTLASRYYGQLIDHVTSMGLSTAVVFLPTDSRPASMSRGEARTWRHLKQTLTSVRLTAFVTPRVVFGALRTWLRLSRSLPDVSAIKSAIANDGEVAAMWSLLVDDFVDSTLGTAAVRASIVGHSLRNLIDSVTGLQLVIYPFEGQGWESQLERVCKQKTISTIGYLHTIMKPWDLRASTALREAPPRCIALHGSHDRAELDLTTTTAVSVEALRYTYLAQRQVRSQDITNKNQLLIVMGSDCENSRRQYLLLSSELSRQAMSWSIVVKPHPQCEFVNSSSMPLRVAMGTLDHAMGDCSAVFLCGTAAPLDSYLFGLPTATLKSESGYSMSPLEPNDMYFVGDTPTQVVEWLHLAMNRSHTRPDASYYFDLAPGYQKWESVIRKALSATA